MWFYTSEETFGRGEKSACPRSNSAFLEADALTFLGIMTLSNEMIHQNMYLRGEAEGNWRQAEGAQRGCGSLEILRVSFSRKPAGSGGAQIRRSAVIGTFTAALTKTLLIFRCELHSGAAVSLT